MTATAEGKRPRRRFPLYRPELFDLDTVVYDGPVTRLGELPPDEQVKLGAFTVREYWTCHRCHEDASAVSGTPTRCPYCNTPRGE